MFPGVVVSADAVFDSKVLPILKEQCLPCHDERLRSSGLSVMSIADLMQGGALRGPVIAPGKPEVSALLKSLRGETSPRMPMGKAPLPADAIQAIESWISGLSPSSVGAKTQGWSAFGPIKRPELPVVRNVGLVKNPIDHFVLSRVEAKGLRSAPEAPKALLMRRLYFDLVGLPPTPEEAKEYLSNSSPNTYEELVDKLLSDSRYGERWGRHWLDVARYADTDGFEGDMERPHMWRYRDYVVQSINKDKPYDQFVREQIAGDEMASNPDGLVAVGFLRLAAWHPIGVTEEARQALLSEMTSAVSSVFLGLTVKCAQCHDHKYDPISQKDFYRMQSFFMPIELADAKMEFRDAQLRRRMDDGQKEYAQRLKQAEARFAAYEKQLLPKLDRILKEEQGPNAQASGKILFDRIVRNDAGTLSPAAEPKFTLDEKQTFLNLYSEIDPGIVRTLRDAGGAKRQLARYDPVVHTIRNAAVTSRGPGLPQNHIRLGGDYNRLGELVTPGFLSSVRTGQDAVDVEEEIPGRVKLADWITNPNNPLPARVMVNRIWLHLFGEGIIATPSDFGKNGARPSHPELLDWLASEFVASKWSMKAMVRLMVTSSTYRQTSLFSTPDAEKADPSNQLLWRTNRKRIEGEIIRDSFLAMTGRLNPEREGPGVFPALPGNLTAVTIKNKPIWETSSEADVHRRSLYIFQRRQMEVPFLSLMDAPVLNFSCDRRNVSTTAVQALTLMNDDFSQRSAVDFARRLRKDVGPDPKEQVEWAFQLALARRPSADEARTALDFIRKLGAEGLDAFCRVLLNANEFVYVN